MKEITRIHIAKIPYDAELDAKKALENYLKALEAYSHDADIMDDIEIRITEILAERGIQRDGVVGLADVEALKQQLGEPRDFMGEGDIAIGSDIDEEGEPDAPRKLFRDTDRAVLGGVLAGIAAFFKLNPAVIRILFIILAIASFGMTLLAYVVLWIAVPPARTAADKLQMMGRSVTISSIRQFNEDETTSVRNEGPTQAQRVALVILGILCILGAVAAAAITLFVVGFVVFGVGGHSFRFLPGDDGGFLVAAFVLAVVSGLLLAILFALGAYASLAMRATKRVLVSMGIVVVLGVLSFGTAIGLAQYGSLRYEKAVQANTYEEQLPLPANTKTIDGLEVNAPGVQVRYIVTNEAPRAVSRIVGDAGVHAADMTFTLEGTTLKLQSKRSQTDYCKAFWCEDPFVTIYGPALMRATSLQKSAIDYVATTQETFDVTLDEGAEFMIESGTISRMTVASERGSEFVAKGAGIADVTATLEHGTVMELGIVRNLSLQTPQACPIDSGAHVEAADVTSGKIIHNGQEIAVRSTSGSCTNISIDNERDAL